MTVRMGRTAEDEVGLGGGDIRLRVEGVRLFGAQCERFIRENTDGNIREPSATS